MIDLLKRRLFPVLAMLGASFGINPDMGIQHVAAMGLVLIAGVLLPSPWEGILRQALRTVVDAWDKHAASMPEDASPPPASVFPAPPTPALREVAVAMARARRVSLSPQHNGSGKKHE